MSRYCSSNQGIWGYKLTVVVTINTITGNKLKIISGASLAVSSTHHLSITPFSSVLVVKMVAKDSRAVLYQQLPRAHPLAALNCSCRLYELIYSSS